MLLDTLGKRDVSLKIQKVFGTLKLFLWEELPHH